MTDQTSAHDPLNGYVPAGLTVEQADALRALGSRRLPRARRRERAHARGRDPRAAAGRRRGVRLRQRAARRRARSTATPTRSPIPGSSPPTSGRCSARARGRSAGWRCPATRPTSHATDAAILELFGEQDHIRRWIELAAGARALPGPAGADLLARLRRAPPGRRALQRDGGVGRAARPDRDRARPPRRRLGRLAAARDRVDARRLGRRGRLAAAERDDQRGHGRVVGVVPPRRRRRDGAVAARRPGVRGRRDASWPASASGARCWPTRAWGSSATPTRATRRRSTPPSGSACASLCDEPANGSTRTVRRRCACGAGR